MPNSANFKTIKTFHLTFLNLFCRKDLRPFLTFFVSLCICSPITKNQMKLSNRSQTISPDFQIEITPNLSYLILEIIPRLKQPKYKTRSSCILYKIDQHCEWKAYGPRQANLVLIAYASSEGSGEPAHSRSLARTSAARSYKQWIKRNLQTESQIPGPSEWLGMRSWNLSWRNARRHKFAWRGSYGGILQLWVH